MTPINDSLLDKLHVLNFDVQRNIRYHERRMGHYSRLNKTITFIVLVLGFSTAVTSLLAPVSNYFLMAFGALTVILAAFDLMVGTANLAVTHKEFKSKYLSLSVELLSLGDKLTSKELDQIDIKMKQLEADEPPAMPMINIMAENDTIQATYDKNVATQYIKPINWFKRLTANFIYWDVEYLVKTK